MPWDITLETFRATVLQDLGYPNIMGSTGSRLYDELGYISARHADRGHAGLTLYIPMRMHVVVSLTSSVLDGSASSDCTPRKVAAYSHWLRATKLGFFKQRPMCPYTIAKLHVRFGAGLSTSRAVRNKERQNMAQPCVEKKYDQAMCSSNASSGIVLGSELDGGLARVGLENESSKPPLRRGTAT